VYSTRSDVCTRTSLTDNLARKSAPRACRSSRQTSRRGLSCVTGWWQAEHAGNADFRARILARKSARMSVSVLWNLSFIQHCHDTLHRRQNTVVGGVSMERCCHLAKARYTLKQLHVIPTDLSRDITLHSRSQSATL